MVKNAKEGLNKSGVYFSNEQVSWNIGIYIRLSVADGNDVSLSVKNQEKIIQFFLKNEFKEPYKIYKKYVDDGISGTTDNERFAFQEMIHDIESGKINCVISKTLSRVFRNYSDQGYFLEEFFPRMGIRFITLESPQIDTYVNPGIVHGYELPLNGIVNDRLAESTSMAVRQTFKNMRKEGKFQGGFPPYGYIRNPDDKYSFIIDDVAADVVRQIFSWYVYDRIGIESIKNKLNENSILNPTGYKKSKGCKYQNPGVKGKESYAWTARSVKMILKNRTYVGDMVQGKSTIISYKVHRQIQVPEEQWDIVYNRHEPIIDREIFDKTQELLSLNKSMKSYNTTPSLLSGFVYCSDCNRKMHKRKNGTREYYACSTYYRRNKKDCTPHFIKKDIIENAVLEAIHRQISLINIDEIISEAYNTENKKYYSYKQKQLKTKEKEIRNVEEQIEHLYIDYNKRIITEHEYLKFKQRFNEKKVSLENNYTKLKSEIEDEEKSNKEFNKWLEIFKKNRNIDKLNRQVLEEMVSRIYVNQNKDITIKFKYDDLFINV